MNDKPRTRGRVATTRTQRTRVAGAAISRTRGEEDKTPPKKITRGRGTERASSLLRSRKAKAEEDVAIEAQAVSAPAEDPIVANLPETETATLPPVPQASEVKDKAASEDETVTEGPVRDTSVTLSMNEGNTVDADTETVSQEAGSTVAHAATEVATEIAQTKTLVKGTRKSIGTGSGAAAGRGEAPKIPATKKRMPKAEPVKGKRAVARTEVAEAEPDAAAGTRGRATRKKADAPKVEAAVSVEARKPRRKPTARKATTGAEPAGKLPTRRKAGRTDIRTPRQSPVPTPAPATLAAEVPMSAPAVDAVKPRMDRAPFMRTEATAFGAAPDRIMSETMDIAQFGFEANVETLQALMSARTPVEFLEVQVRSIQIMGAMWTRHAARMQDFYLSTIRGGPRG